jgi:hypothetical protein
MHNVAINVKSKVFLPGAFFVSFFFFLVQRQRQCCGDFCFYFLLFDVFLDRWHFGGKWNPDGILEYSFKTDGILEVCRNNKRCLSHPYLTIELYVLGFVHDDLSGWGYGVGKRGDLLLYDRAKFPERKFTRLPSE